jgi:hypothetical protein
LSRLQPCSTTDKGENALANYTLGYITAVKCFITQAREGSRFKFDLENVTFDEALL